MGNSWENTDSPMHRHGAAIIVAGSATLVASIVWLALRRRQRKPRLRSGYVEAAILDGRLVGDRSQMINFFLKDVATNSAACAPSRAIASAIRFVTWNINILTGPDWSTPIAAHDVANLLREVDPDVIVLQEVPVDRLDVEWDGSLAEPMARVRELDRLLDELGYTTRLRSTADNPTLLATRLRVLRSSTFTLDEDGPTASVNGKEVWCESRGAVLAELELPGTSRGAKLRCYATHLSHKDATLVRPTHPSEIASSTSGNEAASALPPMRHELRGWEGAREVGGVRRRQAATLLRHWQQPSWCPGDVSEQPSWCPGGASHDLSEAEEAEEVKEAAAVATIILADFNQPIPEHYDAEEWAVVAAGLQAPWVNQPLDDGVRALLRREGFRCAYDEAPPSRTNFRETRGRSAPLMTHWTGTVVDFAYVHGEHIAVCGAHVQPTPLSDHLPVIVDVIVA